MVLETKKYIKNNIPLMVGVWKKISNGLKCQRSKYLIRKIVKERKVIYLEVGAGNKKGRNEWITLDVTTNCDIYWDLRNGIPFPNESVTKIYSSHFLEHLTFKEGQKFIDDCLRVLIPDGIFSICVPNSKIYIDFYYMSDNLKKNNKEYLSYTSANNNTTKIDFINYMAYMDGNHKYMFDEENLLYILKAKGFRNAHLREFDPNIDLSLRHYESIYAEALK